MLYLLDANVLIDANRDYYPLDRIPEFWEWLHFEGKQGTVKIPIEQYEEVIANQGDPLTKWIKRTEVKEALLLQEPASPPLVAKVVEDSYGIDLTDVDIETIGRDPFLVSYALADHGQRIIVSTEASKPSKKRQNRKVPNVCNDWGIECFDTFKFIRETDFSTDWQVRLKQ